MPNISDNIEKRLSKLNGTSQQDYISRLTMLIRRKYTISDEIAVLRQRDTKPEEFEAYNSYVEECKRAAKEYYDI